MTTLAVNDIPEYLVERVKRQARKKNTSLESVILKVLEEQAGRLEAREDIEREGSIITNDPYASAARDRAQFAAAKERVNGSVNRTSKAFCFLVDIIPDDLRERLQRQADYRKTTLDELTLDAVEVGIGQIEFYEEMAAGPIREFSISPSEIVARQRAQRDAPIEF